MKNVFIVGYAPEYAKMWLNNGFYVVDKMEEADIVQFIGGADVNPKLYGERPHPTTTFSGYTDEQDIASFQQAKKLNLPCVGICRGGQFLNVMSGGSMWQDVDGHATRNGHHLVDHLSDETILVSSTHHQMMRPSDEGLVLATATESTYRQSCGDVPEHSSGDHSDVEVVYYDKTDCLCFQPHPEFFDKDHECQQYYFSLIEHCFG